MFFKLKKLFILPRETSTIYFLYENEVKTKWMHISLRWQNYQGGKTQKNKVDLLKEQYLTLLGWLIVKDPDAQKDWTQKETGAAEDEMVRQRHPLNGHEFKQTPGDGGQRILACYRPYGHKELQMT